MIKKIAIAYISLTGFTDFDAQDFSLRKYEHVKDFYSPITSNIVNLCLRFNTPPGSILAICGWETGYGSGYVYRITGNILSVQGTSSDYILPPLTLPVDKFDNYILDYNEIGGGGLSEDIVKWKKRPPSFKKDYRPDGIAGTSSNLAHFEYHPDFRNQASLLCIKDFLSKRLSKKSNILVYRKTRQWLNNLVKIHGKKILFDRQINLEFIERMGGKPNSFCPHKSWVTNVKNLIKRGGFCKLASSINKTKNFNKSWNLK